MSRYNTYTTKGKTIGLVFLFKYDLNGNLKGFEIDSGQLDEKQIPWLFSQRFPATEAIIKLWMKDKDILKHFEITKAAADISFAALWELYDHKVAKADAEKSFKKLKESEQIKCFTSLPGYNEYLNRKRTSKAMLATFINKRYFEDEWHKA